MFTYSQADGWLYRDNRSVGKGYSGRGEGLNNPALQMVKCVGPLPQGLYTIEPPEDSKTHGPFAMALIPDKTNQMFERSGFMIHGDNAHLNESASEGCMIFSRVVRNFVWDSGDRVLKVVERFNV